MKYGVFGDVLIRIRTKHKSKRWIVIVSFFEIIIHTDIHIHLSNILMGDFCRFQVNQYKALENVIIKHKIYIIIVFFRVNMLLSGNECISLS